MGGIEVWGGPAASTESRGWELSPLAAALLGHADGKLQVGVSALCLCLQRKCGVPGGCEGLGGEIVVASMSGCGVFSLQAGDGPGLVGSVAHNLQSACASGISSVKKVPAVAWDAAEGLILFTPRRLSRAMETVDALGGTLVSAPKHLLGTLYSYVPVSL